MTARALTAIGGGLLACAAGAAWLGDLTHGHLPPASVVYFAAALLYLAALAAVLRLGAADDEASRRRALGVVVAVAAGMRLALLAADPSLSQDIARYVWEGRIQWAGFNPYAFAPASDALRPLRDPLFLRVNHPEVPAVYGPLLQVLFRLLAGLGGVLAFKAAFVAVEAGLIALIVAGLRARGAHPALALVYAWHPLAALEVAGQGHLEPVPVALLFAAVHLDARGRPRLAALALGASVAAKYLALLALPALVLAAPGWRARAARLGWAALPAALLGGLYAGAGSAAGAGLTTFGRIWRFNEGCGFAAIDAALRHSGASAWICRRLPDAVTTALLGGPPGGDPGLHLTLLLAPTKAVVGLIVVAATAWAAWPRPGEADGRGAVRRGALTAVAVFLLCSPVVHPWYALWIIPFLPGWIAKGSPPTASAWLLWSLVVPCAYSVLLQYDGVDAATWVESAWVRAAEYVPFVALAAVSLRLGRAPSPPSGRSSVMSSP